jgi:hypothetical protein
MASNVVIPAVSRNLLRHWRSIPLAKLQQGSTLVVRSSVRANLVIQSLWRDDGHASLEQVFSEKEMSQVPLQSLVDMIVTNSLGMNPMTSTGRLAPQVSIELCQATVPTTTLKAATASSSSDIFSAATVTPPKPIEKVMLDDGTLLPDSEAFSPPPLGTLRVDYTDGVSHIRCRDPVINTSTFPTSSSWQEDATQPPCTTTLTIQIPEKTNIICNLSQGGNISIFGKVEGDAELLTAHGDIRVDKLRGHLIKLQNGTSPQKGGRPNNIDSNAIHVATSLEAAQVSIQTFGGRLRAKQIHARAVNISVESEDPTSSSTPHDDNVPDTSAWNEQNHHNGDDDADDEGSLVDIGALFVSGNGGGATIDVKHRILSSRRAVRIKSHHGPVRVSSTRNVVVIHGVQQEVPSSCREEEDEVKADERERLFPLIELGGVNGSCEVAIDETRLLAAAVLPHHYLDDSSNHMDWTSCLVHIDSLLPETVSVVTADCGNVSITLDRKVQADLRLLSSGSHWDDVLAETTALLSEEADPEMIVNILSHLTYEDANGSAPPIRRNDGATDVEPRRVDIRTNAFTTRRSFLSPQRELDYEDGFVENKSAEPDSRFERKMSGGGKIHLDGAANQALKSFSDSTSATANLKSDSDNDGSARSTILDADDLSSLRPLLAVIGRRSIVVETLSWIGAIARRYGLNDATGGRPAAGRTASRRGRLFAVPHPTSSSEKI